MTTTDSTVELGPRFAGVLLGTAVGDALGLPAENLSAERKISPNETSSSYRDVGKVGFRRLEGGDGLFHFAFQKLALLGFHAVGIEA